MLNDSAIIPNVGSISEHDFDAVAIEIENGGIEVAILLASGCWCTVWTASSGKGCSVEVSYGRPTRSGECDMRRASFYAMSTCQLRCIC